MDAGSDDHVAAQAIRELGEAIKYQGEREITVISGLGSFWSGLLQTQASC